MNNCPKCGFDINNMSLGACPKCGVVFEKIRERADQEKTRERVSRSAEKVLEFQQEANSKYLDWEYSVDALTEKRRYALCENLSFAIIVLTLIVVCTEILGMFYLYRTLYWMPVNERIFALVGVGVALSAGIVVFLSIAAFLIMQKEIAKNTWATREYLRRIHDGMDSEQ